MLFPIRNPENYDRLRRLPAIEAIQHFLDGAFTIGEDAALFEAIQKGLSLPLSHQRIESVLLNALDTGITPEDVRAKFIRSA